MAHKQYLPRNVSSFLRQASLTILFWPFVSPFALADIHISGAVENDTCTLSQGTSETIALPTFQIGGAVAVGDHGKNTRFSIGLTGCGAAARGVRVTFQGAAAPGEQNVVTLSPAKGLAAEGLGIALYDAAQQPVRLNQPGASHTLSAGGDLTLTYLARYEVTAMPVTSGIADATVTATLNYD